MAGPRAEEPCQVDIGDIRTTDDGAAVIHVKGKGGKERSVPIEAELLSVIATYLDSRAARFPGATKRQSDVPGFRAVAVARAGCIAPVKRPHLYRISVAAEVSQ